MSKHTPGPWEVVGQHVFTMLGATNANGSTASDRDGWNIATINPWSCTNQDEEEEDMPASEVIANAVLIAAAPELLDALEKIKIRLEVYLDDERDMAESSMQLCLDYAQQAIAKARGEQ